MDCFANVMQWHDWMIVSTWAVLGWVWFQPHTSPILLSNL